MAKWSKNVANITPQLNNLNWKKQLTGDKNTESERSSLLISEHDAFENLLSQIK